MDALEIRMLPQHRDRRVDETDLEFEGYRFRGQAGISMIEILIGLLILGMTVGGIAAATNTTSSTAQLVNNSARMNILMTGFGEAIKALPYQNCALPSQYQQVFDTGEAALPDETQQIQNASDATLEILDIEIDPNCPSEDSGIQTITYRVGIDGRFEERTIVKRSDAVNPAELKFEIRKERRSQLNDPLVVWWVYATTDADIFQFEWYCEGGWALDPDADPPTGMVPDFITYSASDPEPECRYTAPSAPGQMQFIGLRVTEVGTNRVVQDAQAFELETTPAPHMPPVANLEVVSTPTCIVGDECHKNVDVHFRSTGEPPVDASIIEWIWDFGDGSPLIVCTPTSGDPTGALCLDQVHQYDEGGEYPARLRVRDSFGSQSAPAIRNVVIEGDHILRPVVKPTTVNGSTAADPAWAISPQLVNFDGGGSQAYDGNGDLLPPGVNWDGSPLQYHWDFGHNGQTATGRYAQYEYPQTHVTSLYNVVLTVTAKMPGSHTETVSGKHTLQVRMDPLVPPIGIRNTVAKGDIWLIRNAYFDFQWTNVPHRRPQDHVYYEIRIGSSGGFCGFFGASTRVHRTTPQAWVPNTSQTYRFQFSSSPRGFNGICSTDNYNFQARSVMVRNGNPASGDCPVNRACSAWSPSQPLDPTFF